MKRKHRVKPVRFIFYMTAQIMHKFALLVVDVQEALCTGQWKAFDIELVVDRINDLAGRARVAGWPVIFIQHEDDETLKFGTDGWQLYQRLDTKPDDQRVRKTVSNAFHHTELASLLEAQGVSSLVICGLQSEFCIASTVRGALGLGYSVVLAADAHSTIDNSAVHAAQISAHQNTLFANSKNDGAQIQVISAAEISI